VDALSPVILRERSEQAILAWLDADTWARDVEALELESITTTAGAWRSISTTPD
jgi:hypothetical protein